jgi:hypothetical protein
MKSNTYRFAKLELDILSKTSTDLNQFKKEILAICEIFGKSGQSGGSAPYMANYVSKVIKKLCLQEPICPVTGIEDEWVDVSEHQENQKKWFQNRRCSALFKDSSSNLSAYYLDAIVWKNQNGDCHSGSALLKDGPVLTPVYSRQRIKSFPFTPKKFYIDVISTEIPKEGWEHIVKSEKQLQKVFNYYNKFE